MSERPALGQRIRAARKAACISQAELARLTKMSQPNLCDIERGHVPNPGIATIKRIAEAIGCTVGELVD